MTPAMFTEGLDPNALRWVREVPATTSMGNQQRLNALHGLRSGGSGGIGRRFVLPRPEKFQSGHLPASRTMPMEDNIASGSDMEDSSDSDKEIYSGRMHYTDSSPEQDAPFQQRRPPSYGPKTAVDSRYAAPDAARRWKYYSDTNSELSSSKDASCQKQPSQQQYQKEKRRIQTNASDYTDGVEEESDSGGSVEFSPSLHRSNGGSFAQSRRGNPNESCSSNLPFRTVEKQCDVPSAPPLNTSRHESHHEINDIPSVGGSGISGLKGLNGSHINEISPHPTIATKPVDQKKVRTASIDVEAVASSASFQARVPTFHASEQGRWHSVIAYDACVRLCLHSWAGGCMEAPIFLENECALLRSSFGLHQVLLQSEEELLGKQSAEMVNDQPKKSCGNMKLEVRKVRMSPDMPYGCQFSTMRQSKVALKSFRRHMSNFQSVLSVGWESLRNVHVSPRLSADSSFSHHSMAYVRASTQYIKEVSSLFRIGVTTLRSKSSVEPVQETYYCLLKLRSSIEETGIRMLPGSGETRVFFPDSVGDDLIIEVYDSKGTLFGRVVAQVASIVEDPTDKIRWWSIYREPEHELVGKVQLSISYTYGNNNKCGSVAETAAYDLVMEVAMKVQHFQQRNLLLHGSWNWLLNEFALYYGVSDSYTKLRYLSYIMDVATPTNDCLTLVHALLLPVVSSKTALSHQENRILGEIQEHIEKILSMVFENYKSLDESSPSGIIEVFRPSTGSPAPALLPAVKLYTLLHDILSPEAQLKLCSYFQVAAKKRSRRHLGETDEFVATSSEGAMMDAISMSTAYQKMKGLCLNVRNEIYMDIEIHGSHVLPSFVDLPNIAASIYSVELCSRLRAFLVSCPPSAPSPPVAELVIATSDLQRDLSSWNVSPVKGGVDAKELFHLYIILWIQDKRLSLLESCRLDKIKWSGVRTIHSTTPFVDEMYDRLRDTLNEYDIIIRRWPEYTFVLENAIADIEKAVLDTLDKQYADELAPLKDGLIPKKFGLKYVQKLARRNSVCPYTAPDDLGILLNTMKRLLDVLRPRIELQLKSWGSCIPDGGNAIAGERLSEVTVLLRAKFRNYIQAVVEKLAENTRVQNSTKLKKIIQDSKDALMESEIRLRMQPLKDQLVKSINHIHGVFGLHVFIALCRGFWDRMGQDVLNFLENRKENRTWYKASRVAVAFLDDIFISQMQSLLGNSMQENDHLEPPRSIIEVRSVLCKDVPNHKDSNFYY